MYVLCKQGSRNGVDIYSILPPRYTAPDVVPRDEDSGSDSDSPSSSDSSRLAAESSSTCGWCKERSLLGCAFPVLIFPPPKYRLALCSMTQPRQERKATCVIPRLVWRFSINIFLSFFLISALDLKDVFIFISRVPAFINTKL